MFDELSFPVKDDLILAKDSPVSMSSIPLYIDDTSLLAYSVSNPLGPLLVHLTRLIRILLI
ncbi:unnamed protein product [Prunus armeniaca]